MLNRRNFIALLVSLWILACVSAAQAEDKLVLVLTLIRHGDRSPTHNLSTSPREWNPGLGELTPLGMSQEYQLGRSFRTRYVERLRFLPEKYRENVVYARSTDYNRTIVSAGAFLCGLYPPGTGPALDDGKPALPGAWQPIPVRTLPADQDRLLLGAHFHRQMMHERALEDAEWKAETARLQARFPRWSQVFGRKIDSLFDLNAPGDNVNIRLLKHLPLPQGLSEAEARELVRVQQWAMAREARSRKVACLVTTPFFQEVAAQMESATRGTQKHRFILYSAHDSTLLPVMSQLGAPLDAQPPYASNLTFELYDTPEGYSVRARYNDRELFLPFMGKGASCSLDKFRTSVLDDSW